MPTPVRPPRLWLRKARRDAITGKIRTATWVIIDRGRHIATGCAQWEVEKADQCLARYRQEKYEPRRRERDIEQIDVADVLLIYLEDSGARQSDPKKLARRVERLNAFWGGKMLSEVNGGTCRKYAVERATTGARRELEDLRAAIRHHKKEGFHRGEIVVTLPGKSEPRSRWLTRSEAARLLWTCWRTTEVQKGWQGYHP